MTAKKSTQEGNCITSKVDELYNPDLRGKFLSSVELASYLGVRPDTINTWRFKAVGPAYLKRGGLILYRVGDVVDWLEEGRVSR